MDLVRYPAVSGIFYPEDPEQLRSEVRDFIRSAEAGKINPQAIIAPHAGYVYSGPIAGTAYAFLKNRAEQIRRVLLLGPAHRVAFSGLALSSASHFKTPLGLAPLDTAAAADALSFSFVQTLDRAHLEEHCLEVQLPFLQEVLKDFKVLPVLVGDAETEEVAAFIEAFPPSAESVVIVSSDLSHYHRYEEACRIDQLTAKQIEALDDEQLSSHQACGAGPIRGLLKYSKQHQLKALGVHLANSGDISGERDKVVGYGAFVFY
jgi:MEMO1 family protein